MLKLYSSERIVSACSPIYNVIEWAFDRPGMEQALLETAQALEQKPAYRPMTWETQMRMVLPEGRPPSAKLVVQLMSGMFVVQTMEAMVLVRPALGLVAAQVQSAIRLLGQQLGLIVARLRLAL
jgi:hypothetical protein